MSGIAGLPGYGTLSQILGDSAQVKRQLDQATAQTASGQAADTYAGLGTGAQVSLDLRPQIASAQNWQQTISSVGTRLDTTQSVLKQLSDIATTAIGNISGVITQSPSASSSQVTSMAAEARDALQNVAGLMNTQVGGVYIFAGEDTSNPPVPAGAGGILSGTFFGTVNAAVAGLATNGIAPTTAATLAAATGATTPFSATMGTTPPAASVAAGQTVQTGVLATSSASGTMSGPSSTGSYVGDLMRALATIGSLDAAGGASAASINGLLDDARTSLQGVVSGISSDQALMGSRQDQLTAIGSGHADTVTALTTQVSDVEDVDMSQVATRVAQLQSQLQASYQLIAGMRSLSLANILQSG